MSSSYFEHDADIGIIGRGLIIEQSFEAAAHAVFAIITNIEAVHPRTVVALEFEESDLELALVVWLNLILAKAREFGMVFSHFYLQRQNDHWHAKAAGEKWRDGLERGVEVNCALANRQILTHLTRATFAGIYPKVTLETLFDIPHNTCKEEQHEVDGKTRWLYVHRKGATRAFAPGHPRLPARYRDVGQPVIIGGSMSAGSYILAGSSHNQAFASCSHGAGRAMSSNQALKQWNGRALIDDLERQGILIRTRSMRGAAEEAPGAYKDVDQVAEVTEQAGLARRIAFLRPKVCIKG